MVDIKQRNDKDRHEEYNNHWNSHRACVLLGVGDGGRAVFGECGNMGVFVERLDDTLEYKSRNLLKTLRTENAFEDGMLEVEFKC